MWQVINPIGFKYAAFLFMLLTLVILYHDKERQGRIIALFTHKVFIIGVVGIIIWSYITLKLTDDTEENKKIKYATRSAILAFLIAILSEMKLTIAPFWLIWIAAYYLHVDASS